MAALSAFQAVNAFGGAAVESKSMRAQADYQKKISELNNKAMDYEISQTEEQARDAEARGMQSANKRAQKTRLQVGAQRASAAASGIDPEFGSASDSITETETIGEADVAAIKTNAWREAFGFTSKANEMRGAQNAANLQTRTSVNALNYGAKATMITGATDAATYGAKAYGQYKDDNPSKDDSGRNPVSKKKRKVY